MKFNDAVVDGNLQMVLENSLFILIREGERINNDYDNS
jgi:hypothetical protein